MKMTRANYGSGWPSSLPQYAVLLREAKYFQSSQGC